MACLFNCVVTVQCQIVSLQVFFFEISFKFRDNAGHGIECYVSTYSMSKSSVYNNSLSDLTDFYCGTCNVTGVNLCGSQCKR